MGARLGVSVIEKAVILSTGDELTTGKVVDTNSAYIADRLLTVGIKVAAILKVGDDRENLLWRTGRWGQIFTFDSRVSISSTTLSRLALGFTLKED